MIYKEIVLREEEFEERCYIMLFNSTTTYEFLVSGVNFKLRDKYTHLVFVERESGSYIKCVISNRRQITAGPDWAIIEVTIELSQ